VIRREALLGALALFAGGCSSGAPFTKVSDKICFERGRFALAWSKLDKAVALTLQQLNGAIKDKKIRVDGAIQIRQTEAQWAALTLRVEEFIASPADVELDWDAVFQAIEMIVKLVTMVVLLLPDGPVRAEA
jgi:hypothetical protein